MGKGKKVGIGVGIGIRTVIITFFAMTFFGLVLVSHTVNISAITESEQKCIDAIPEDATQIERLVAIRECQSKEISEGSYSGKQVPADIRQAEQDVNECLTRYETFKRVTEQEFEFLGGRLTSVCIKLYNDELWNYRGDDRFEKLVEKYLEILYEDVSELILYHNALAECKKLETSREVVDCKEQIAQKFLYQKSKEPDFLTMIYQDRINLLEEENLKLEQELEKKHAVIMEQIKVISDLANMIKNAIYTQLSTIFHI